MTKLIIFDIDGTLISYNNGVFIPPETIKALNKLRANGQTIAFASARSYLTARPLMEKLNINNAVLHNGSQIILDKKCIFSKKMGKIISRKICSQLLNTSLCVFAFDGEYVYVHNATKESINYIIKETGKFDVIKSLCDINQSLYSISVYGDNGYINQMLKDIKSARYKENQHEISAKNVSKKNGIIKLASKLNFNTKDIIAVGDGLNDIEMIKKAGIGIAVGGACKKLKQVADIVSDNIENGGIYKIFKDLKLI